MKYIITIAIFLWAANFTAFAQKDTGVVLNEPEEIELLLERHIEFMAELETVDGYRVQLGAANRLSDANKLKKEYEETYEGREAYIIFTEPTYRVRIGDFLKEIEAYALMQEVKEDFPEAFVVRDKIYIQHWQ